MPKTTTLPKNGSIFSQAHNKKKTKETTMNTFLTRSRLPRLGRVPEAQRPHFRLTERDRQIIHAVYRYRVLTTNQVESLFFMPIEGKTKSLYNSRCRLRLQA